MRHDITIRPARVVCTTDEKLHLSGKGSIESNSTMRQNTSSRVPLRRLDTQLTPTATQSFDLEVTGVGSVPTAYANTLAYPTVEPTNGELLANTRGW